MAFWHARRCLNLMRSLNVATQTTGKRFFSFRNGTRYDKYYSMKAVESQSRTTLLLSNFNPFSSSHYYNLPAAKHLHTSTLLRDQNKSSSSNDDDGNSSDGGDMDLPPLGEPPQPIMNALMPIKIPDDYPKVPLIAVSRNPLFPRFMKMLEVCDLDLDLSKYAFTALLSVSDNQ
jgi:hypothetical protein